MKFYILRLTQIYILYRWSTDQRLFKSWQGNQNQSQHALKFLYLWQHLYIKRIRLRWLFTKLERFLRKIFVGNILAVWQTNDLEMSSKKIFSDFKWDGILPSNLVPISRSRNRSARHKISKGTHWLHKVPFSLSQVVEQCLLVVAIYRRPINPKIRLIRLIRLLIWLIGVSLIK